MNILKYCLINTKTLSRKPRYKKTHQTEFVKSRFSLKPRYNEHIFLEFAKTGFSFEPRYNETPL